MIHTAIRWGLVALLLPALIFVATTPSSGQFLDWKIIANQVVQIGNQLSQLTQLRNQITQMQNEALGRVGALSQSVRQLSADPTVLLDDNAPWSINFAEPEALRVLNALTDLKSTGRTLTNYWRTSFASVPDVQASDLDALYPDDPQRAAAARESWHTAREEAERQLAAAYAVGDAAEELTERLDLAQASLDLLRNQTNLSGTALQQARLAGQLTDSQLSIATAQLLAYQAARDSLQTHSAEIARRRELANWHRAELRAQAEHDASIAWIRANADAMGADLLLLRTDSP